MKHTFSTWIKLIGDSYRVTSDSAMNSIVYEEIYIQYMGKKWLIISIELHLTQQWTALYMRKYTFITREKLIDDIYRVTYDYMMKYKFSTRVKLIDDIYRDTYDYMMKYTFSTRVKLIDDIYRVTYDYMVNYTFSTRVKLIDDIYRVTYDYMLKYTFSTRAKLIDDLYRVTSDSAMSSIMCDEMYIQYMVKLIDHHHRVCHIWLSSGHHYEWWNIHPVLG